MREDAESGPGGVSGAGTGAASALRDDGGHTAQFSYDEIGMAGLAASAISYS